MADAQPNDRHVFQVMDRVDTEIPGTDQRPNA